MERQDVQPDGSHNVVTLRVASHVWSGIPVHDIRMKARQGRAWHPLNCEQPVLSVVVNEVRGQCEARLDLGVGNASRPSGRQRSAGHVSSIPAGGIVNLSRGGMLPWSVARWFGAGKSLARL